MKTKMRVGEKGQVVIPKQVRVGAGIREGTEVTVELRDDEVVIRRANPPTKSYVEYYTSTYARKLRHEVDLKKLIEEETTERYKRLR